MKRLIISDLHLGAAFTREKLLSQLLLTKEYDELILAGDIIEFLKVPHFTEESKSIFEVLRKVNVPIVYVVGNHDRSLSAFVDSSIGKIKFTKRYEFQQNGRSFVVEHGDKYDRSLWKTRYFMRFVAFLGDISERVFNWNSNNVVHWFMSREKRIKNIRSIMKYNPGCDVYIMGHTHNPEVLIWVDLNENIRTYVNTGDWVEHATYVMIEGSQVRLKNYLKEIS